MMILINLCSITVLSLVVISTFLHECFADIRFASDPRNDFITDNITDSIAFVTQRAPFIEPATFGYGDILIQKGNNSNAFLSSSIDAQQDRRNFGVENGKDMLPFRTLEYQSTTSNNRNITAVPGQLYLLPLRMDEPHAFEIELNIWIVQNSIVVPIKKPVCAGEGYQTGVLSFVVPVDFNQLREKVVAFDGCKKIGDCVLQLYAHSVEPRAYAIATPIIITGWNDTQPRATNNNAVMPKTVDPGVNLSQLANEVCLSSVSPSSNIANAIPRWARHVSDAYNYAYQSSGYSAYSGQQHEAISRNLQAACILGRMTANQGVLGNIILTESQKATLAALRRMVISHIKAYERATNDIINQIFEEAGSTGIIAGQQLATCFRCRETASLSSNRLESSTFIPSFAITNATLLSKARQFLQALDDGNRYPYTNLISSIGVVQIYAHTLNRTTPYFQSVKGLLKRLIQYQPTQEKTTNTTLYDANEFRLGDSELKNKESASKVKEAALKEELLLMSPHLLLPAPSAPLISPTDPSFSNIPGGSSPRTIAAWVKRSTTALSNVGQLEAIISFNTNTPDTCDNRELMVGISSSNNRACVMSCNSANGPVYGHTKIHALISRGAWHHVAVTLSSDSSATFATVYANGIEPEGGSPSILSLLNTDKGTILIGDRTIPNSKFVGAIDDLIIFARKLDSTEVINLMNGIIPAGYSFLFDAKTNSFGSPFLKDVDEKYRIYGLSISSSEDSLARGEYIVIPDYSSASISNTNGIPSGNQNRTISVWIKETQRRNRSASILSFGKQQQTCDATEVSFYVSESGNPGVTVCSVMSLVSTQQTVLGEWNYIAVTYNANRRFTLYLNNGPPVTSGVLSNPLQTSLESVFIGMRGVNKHDPFVGYLDNLHIYNRTLTAAEIERDRVGQSGTLSRLVANFQMNFLNGQTDTAVAGPVAGPVATLKNLARPAETP